MSKTIKCTTWNILSRKYVPLDFSIQNHTTRMQMIHAKISEFNSDIVCLQEVDIDIPFTYDDTVYDIIIHKITKKRTNTFGNVILWKKSIFIADLYFISSCSLQIILRHIELNTPFYIGNVHLRSGFTNNEHERVNQMNSIFKKWENMGNLDGIIMGDFNDEYGDSMSNAGLLFQRIQHSEFVYPMQSPNSTYNHISKNYSQFDWAITHKIHNFQYIDLPDDEILRTIPNAEIASDHYPIHFTWEL